MGMNVKADLFYGMELPDLHKAQSYLGDQLPQWVRKALRESEDGWDFGEIVLQLTDPQSVYFALGGDHPLVERPGAHNKRPIQFGYWGSMLYPKHYLSAKRVCGGWDKVLRLEGWSFEWMQPPSDHIEALRDVFRILELKWIAPCWCLTGCLTGYFPVADLP